ncbi:MAG: YeeE/YedE family protein [Xanthobacteraceae bacterium]|nr:YeeE/YedE family protein [Xanthobacteraceae bacterium]QYK44208.1 MAG: YeeE/YedE family protein [Xanthobacteraceae bacterium]
MSASTLSLWAGFVIGIAFGITVQRTGFCLNNAFRGLFVTGDRRKIASFALAMAVAVLATQICETLGLIDLRRAIYLSASLSWLAIPLGGAIFGYGMIASNGCGARSLVLMGQGNLRSFVVLLCLGIAAYATLSGVIAPLRTALAGPTVIAFDKVPSIPRYLEASLGANAARLLPAFLLMAILGTFAFSVAPFRKSPRDIAGGIVVGLLIAAGWLATGWLGQDDFEPGPIASLTFIQPVGETIQYAMLATGARMSFGVAVVCGVFLGALGSALATGTYELQGFSKPTQMLRYMAGGALMGLGGAMALGCSIGQGLTGLSTLAFGSFLAIAGIIAGSLLALRGPIRLPSL